MSLNETKVGHLICDSPVDISQAMIDINLPTDVTMVDIPELDMAD